MDLGLIHECSTESVFASHQIVNWFNGHPDALNLNLEFKNKKTAVLIGNGNVTIDIIRVFSKPLEELASTDIYQPALEILKKSSLENFVIYGRRGIV